MRSCTRILAVAIVVAPTAPAFVVPARRGGITWIPQQQRHNNGVRRFMAGKQQQDEKNIQALQQEIDAAIRQREELRQELEEEIRSFSERYQSVNANLQNADARLEEETRSFQKQLSQEKQIIDGMDQVIVEKTLQLESIKEGGFLQEAFGAIEGLQGTLAPVAALSVVALVGESILRDRKRTLQEERDRERRRRLAEAEARQQLDEQAPLPAFAKAVRSYSNIFCLYADRKSVV